MEEGRDGRVDDYMNKRSRSRGEMDQVMSGRGREGEGWWRMGWRSEKKWDMEEGVEDGGREGKRKMEEEEGR